MTMLPEYANDPLAYAAPEDLQPEPIAPDELRRLFQMQDRYGLGAPQEPVPPPVGSSFGDRLALALENVPTYRGRGFAGHLLSGAARGYSAAALPQIRERAAERKAAQEANRAALVATAKARSEALTQASKDQSAQARARMKLFGQAAKPSMLTMEDVRAANDAGVPLGIDAVGQPRSNYPQLAKVMPKTPLKSEKPEYGPMDTMLPSGLTPRQVAAVGTLTDNVRSDPDIRDFITVRDNFERIRSSARAKTGVGDMNVVFAYMKVLDPTSVVRETEYKNAADAIGRIPKLATIPRHWWKGDLLTEEGRKGFEDQARAMYELKARQHKLAIRQYERQAKAYGIDPALVLRDYTAPESVPVPKSGGFFDDPNAPSRRAK